MLDRDARIIGPVPVELYQDWTKYNLWNNTVHNVKWCLTYWCIKNVNHLCPSLSQNRGNLVGGEAPQVDVADLQYVVAALKPAVFVGDPSR